MKKLLAIIALILAFLMLDGCAAAATELPISVTSIPTETLMTAAPTVPPATEIPVTEVPVTEPPAAPGPETISREEAISIALDHAGFTADQVTRLECEFDRDDRVPEYELEFHQGKYEYSYDIHAETGEILSWEKEIDH